MPTMRVACWARMAHDNRQTHAQRLVSLALMAGRRTDKQRQLTAAAHRAQARRSCAHKPRARWLAVRVQTAHEQSLTASTSHHASDTAGLASTNTATPNPRLVRLACLQSREQKRRLCASASLQRHTASGAQHTTSHQEGRAVLAQRSPRGSHTAHACV